MAGAGYKLFNTGDVLTAAQVNTYLMEQTVMVFADAAARTTALSGVVSEGMISYLKDTNAVEVYNGSAWVASDDPNAIQNTIVDAKGDLISASAADTPARLAVGANDTILIAASGETTGLKWGGAYTTWTPTFTNFTLGNGTATARYAQIGKLVHCQLKVVLGSTSSVTGLIEFTLPITASTSIQGNYIGLNNATCLDSGVAQYPARCALISSTNAVIFALAAGGTYLSTSSTSATVPFTWGSTDQFLVNFVYEAA